MSRKDRQVLRLHVGGLAQLAMLLLALACFSENAWAANKKYAVLVVGDLNNRQMVQREEEVARSVLEMRASLGLTDLDLPILTYHFDKGGERSYCETKLGIASAHLLFVGVVEREDKAVRTVLIRINNVVDSKDASTRIMTEVARRLGRDVTVLKPGTPTPPPPVGPPPSSPTEPLSVMSVSIVNNDGRTQTTFSTADPAVNFKVVLRNNEKSIEHRHILEVKVYGPDGKLLTPGHGGSFVVKPGEDLGNQNMVNRADVDGSCGFKIHGYSLEKNVGNYLVVFELDRKEIGRYAFQVTPDIELSDVHLEGKATSEVRTRFFPDDDGVYVMVYFRNLATDRRHEHTIRTICYGPDGQVYGTPLQDPVVVEPGQDLSGKAYVRRGYMIKGAKMGSNLGAYRFVLELDGRQVKSIDFEVVSP